VKHVLGVSAALCWVIPRALKHQALRLQNDYAMAIHDLLAPSVFPAEAASGLTKSERQKLVTVGQCLFRVFPDTREGESEAVAALAINPWL
jgi:hypothetical protein